MEYQRLILKGAAKAFHREVAAEYQCLFLQEGTIFTLSSGANIWTLVSEPASSVDQFINFDCCCADVTNVDDVLLILLLLLLLTLI